MIYSIKFEVYDNAGKLIAKNNSRPDLTNPTVSYIKRLLNLGSYVNIKSETFIANEGKTDLANDAIVNPHFVKYRIDLN